MTDLAAVALPLSVRRGPLQLAVGEVWCTACGAEGVVYDGNPDANNVRCIVCGSRNLVAAAQVLRPGEYAVIH